MTESLDALGARRYLALGVCGACLGKIYGVNKETIYAIDHKRTWAHLPDAAE